MSLPPGDYVVKIVTDRLVAKERSVSVNTERLHVVRNDALRTKAEAQLIQDAGSDSFAKHVAVRFGVMPEVLECIKMLKGDDLEKAKEAASHLRCYVERLPVGHEKALQEAVEIRLRALGEGKGDPEQTRGAVLEIVWCAACLKGDESLEAILTVARAKTDTGLRAYAVMMLWNFSGEKARQALEELMKDRDEDVAHAAKYVVHPESRLEDLLAEARDPKAAKRVLAIRRLESYWDVPPVKELLNSLVHDRDPEIQAAAKDAQKGPFGPNYDKGSGVPLIPMGAGE
jgi:hypothetical protein